MGCATLGAWPRPSRTPSESPPLIRPAPCGDTTAFSASFSRRARPHARPRGWARFPTPCVSPRPQVDRAGRLLFESGREGTKRSTSLPHGSFGCPRTCCRPATAGGTAPADMRDLPAAFLHAYGRSWSRMPAGEEDAHSFGTAQKPVAPGRYPVGAGPPTSEPRPCAWDRSGMPGPCAPSRRCDRGRQRGQPRRRPTLHCRPARFPRRARGRGGGDFRGIGRRVNSLLGREE